MKGGKTRSERKDLSWRQRDERKREREIRILLCKPSQKSEIESDRVSCEASKDDERTVSSSSVIGEALF